MSVNILSYRRKKKIKISKAILLIFFLCYNKIEKVGEDMNYCLECGSELIIDYEHKKLMCEYCKKEYDYSNDTAEKEYICLSCDVDFISDKPNLECCPYCNSKNLTVIKLKKNLSVDKLISFTKTQKDFIKKLVILIQ